MLIYDTDTEKGDEEYKSTGIGYFGQRNKMGGWLVVVHGD